MMPPFSCTPSDTTLTSKAAPALPRPPVPSKSACSPFQTINLAPCYYLRTVLSSYGFRVSESFRPVYTIPFLKFSTHPYRVAPKSKEFFPFNTYTGSGSPPFDAPAASRFSYPEIRPSDFFSPLLLVKTSYLFPIFLLGLFGNLCVEFFPPPFLHHQVVPFFAQMLQNRFLFCVFSVKS